MRIVRSAVTRNTTSQRVTIDRLLRLIAKRTYDVDERRESRILREALGEPVVDLLHDHGGLEQTERVEEDE